MAFRSKAWKSSNTSASLNSYSTNTVMAIVNVKMTQ